jgi:hypothetical protein
MRTILIVGALLATATTASAGCMAWDYAAGRWICTLTQPGTCVEWGTVGGRRLYIRSQQYDQTRSGPPHYLLYLCSPSGLLPADCLVIA